MSINELKTKVEELDEELTYHVEELAAVEEDLHEALGAIEYLANRVKYLEALLGGNKDECATPN